MLEWQSSLPFCLISFTLSINFYTKFIDATMLSDEAPFSIVNVACHGCQDEMRSTSDTHEWETRQLVLCISVSTIFRIFFVWMWMTGFQVYHYRGRWWFLKSQKNLFVQAHDFLKFHFSDNYWPKIILQVREVCVNNVQSASVVFECFGSSFLGDSPNNLGGT